MRSYFIFPLGCAVVMTAMPAMADQVRVSVDQNIEGQGNMFNQSVDPVADGRYELTPTIQFSGRPSFGQYAVNYQPSYSRYFRTRSEKGWDHTLSGHTLFQMTAIDKMTLSAQLSAFEGVRGSLRKAEDGSTEVIASSEGEVLQLSANLNYERSLSPRSLMRIGFEFQNYTYENSNNVDNRAFGISAEYTTVTSERLTIGISGVGRYRYFPERSQVPSSSSVVLNANLVFIFRATPAWSLKMDGGPSMIFSDQDPLTAFFTRRFEAALTPDGNPIGRISPTDSTLGLGCQQFSGRPALLGCPFTQLDPSVEPATASVLNGRLQENVLVDFRPGERPGSENSEKLTYFMTFSATRSSENGSTNFSYRRQEQGSGGNAASTIRDSVACRFAFSPDEFWRLVANAGWSRSRSSSTLAFRVVEAGPSGLFSDPDPNTGNQYELAEATRLIPGESTRASNQDQLWAQFSVHRKIDSRLSVNAVFRYEKWLELTVNGLESALYDDFIGSVSVRYEFDPYVF